MAGVQNAQQRSAAVQQALSVVDVGLQAASAYKRPDLVERLTISKRRLADPAFHVFVVGEFKQGKSSLVNALLNAPVCPVDDDIATAVPTSVRYGDEPQAAVLFKPPGEDGADERQEPVREEIPVADVARYVTEASDPEGGRRVNSVDVALPRNVAFTSIYTCTDEYIRPYQTAIIPGATNIGLCNRGFVGHFQTFYDPAIYLIMHDALIR